MIDMNNIILGTGNYCNVKSGNTVSITGDGGNAWGYFGPAYKKLVPKLVTYVPYSEKLETLKKLKEDITKVNEYLEFRKKMLNEKFGSDIVLLCHEPIDEFCHRRLIADYIELKTNIYIPEVSIDESGNIKKLVPIRYKNRLKKII